MVEVEVAAESKSAVVVGVLQEGVKVEVLEGAFFTKAETEVESNSLDSVSACLQVHKSGYLRPFHQARCRMVEDHCPWVAAAAALIEAVLAAVDRSAAG